MVVELQLSLVEIMPNKMTARGFTLIELLITISIISIVFGVIITSSQAVQKQGRDTQRQSDLRGLQSALQQYYADQSFYPEDSTSLNTEPSKLNLSSTTSLNNCTGNPDLSCTNSRTYLNRIPKNPLGSDYIYHAISPFGQPCSNAADSPSKCTNYCIYTTLENAPSTTPAGCTSGNPLDLTVPTPPTGYNYWVTQP